LQRPVEENDIEYIFCPERYRLYATDYASNKGCAPKTTTSQKQKDSATQTTATAETKTEPKRPKPR